MACRADCHWQRASFCVANSAVRVRVRPATSPATGNWAAEITSARRDATRDRVTRAPSPWTSHAPAVGLPSGSRAAVSATRNRPSALSFASRFTFCFGNSNFFHHAAIFLSGFTAGWIVNISRLLFASLNSWAINYFWNWNVLRPHCIVIDASNLIWQSWILNWTPF